jgi:EAL domain-containing protein (putative c-di-GMP-specific phosphodiesterase class I)
MDQAPDNTIDPSADFDIFKSFFDISLSHVDDDWTEIVQKLLHSLREHLNMEVAFLSEFIDGKRRFQVISQIDSSNIEVGDEDSLCDSYCYHIVQNSLPQIIKDTKAHKITNGLKVTRRINIGSYIGVPVILSDGKVYGTLCVFKGVADSRLNQKDLAYVRVIADLSATIIEIQQNNASIDTELKDNIRKVIANGSLTVKLHPVVNLKTGNIVGYEVLSRINDGQWPPHKFFESAVYAGLSEEATTRVLELTKSVFPLLPSHISLSVNITPDLLANTSFMSSLANSGLPLERLVLEITEHSLIDDYSIVEKVLAPLREEGLRIAVDDAGAGYSSLRHVVALAPDIVKLDMTLTKDVHKDSTKQSLIRALMVFAKERRFELVTEGIETVKELQALQSIGVRGGQGFLFDEPQPVEYFKDKHEYHLLDLN